MVQVLFLTYIFYFQAVDNGYWQALNIGGTVPPSRTSQAAMVDTRGRMWIVGCETLTHSRHIDMVAQFSPDFTNPDVQGIRKTLLTST